MTRTRLFTLLLALAVAAAGCGGDSAGDRPPSAKLVDFKKKPPYVNALELDRDGSFLLTTNRGFFRIPKEGGGPQRIRGTIRTKDGSSPVGTFLELHVNRAGELIGSGHPDKEKPLPPYLGFIRSTDRGRTWKVVSRYAEADLHQIREAHGRLYAFDAVLGAILVSSNGGKTWQERFTPRQLVLDFVVDPRDENRLLASTEDQIYRSTDGGDSWRPTTQADSARLDWPAPDALMRADKDGTFQVSDNGGDTWDRVGRIDGEPYKVRAVDAKRAYVALSDGSILETTDGGRRFEERFRP